MGQIETAGESPLCDLLIPVHPSPLMCTINISHNGLSGHICTL